MWGGGAAGFRFFCCSPPPGAPHVFTFKNGRKIRGEIVEQTKDAYFVAPATGGKVRIAKADLKSVEQAPDKPALAPDPVPPAKLPETPATPATDAKPETKPEAKPTAPAPASGTKPEPYVGANAAAVAKARAGLEKLVPLSLQDRRNEYPKVVQDHGCEALLTISGQRTGQGREVEQIAFAALEWAGDKARQPLIRAVTSTRATDETFLQLIRNVYDDSVEDAMVALYPTCPDAGRFALARLFENKGTPRCAPKIAEFLLAASDVERPQLPHALGSAFSQIAQRHSSPDTVVALLAQKVTGGRAPSGATLEAIVLALSAGPREGAAALSQMSDSIAAERAKLARNDDAGRQACDVKMLVVLRGLARMQSDQSLVAIRRIIESESDPVVRGAFLRSLGAARPTLGLVSWLVERWESYPDDAPAIREALATSTQKSLGTEIGPWKDYVLDLREQARQEGR
jgi:hypothetical protein